MEVIQFKYNLYIWKKEYIQHNDIQTTSLIFKGFIHLLLAKLVVFIDII